MRQLSVGRALVLALASGAFAVPPAAAQATRGSSYGFGDSLLDVKTVCPLQYPSNPSGACGTGEGLLRRLAVHSPYAFDIANAYAAGGAGTGSYNVAAVLLPGRATGTLDQITAFVAAGGRIGPRDITLVTGRNNFYQILTGQQRDGAALAVRALGDVDREVAALVAAGARNLVYFDTRSPTAPDTVQVDAYETAFSAGLPATIAAHAAPGVRLRILNYTGLSAAVAANPARFGFSTALSCAADPGCTTAAASVQDRHFLYDQHPTGAGYDLIARYVANLEASADGIAAQANVAAAASDGFSWALLGRASLAALGGERGLFVAGGHDRDRRRTTVGDSGVALGYRDNVGRVIAGITTPLAAGVTAGAAIGYARSRASLSDGGGGVRGRSYQGGAFLGWRLAGAFVDADAGYARHDLSVDRPGVAGDLRASPDAASVFAQARGGYLFGVAGVRAGPVLRFAYDRTRVRRYAERGDPLLAQLVAGATLKSALGSAGIRAEAGVGPVGLFVEGSVARDFEGGRRLLVTANAYAPELAIRSIVPGRYTDRTFGRIDAGLTAPLAGRLRLLVQGSTTVEQRGGAGHAIQAGLHVVL